jgi:hypothetical protein
LDPVPRRRTSFSSLSQVKVLPVVYRAKKPTRVPKFLRSDEGMVYMMRRIVNEGQRKNTTKNVELVVCILEHRYVRYSPNTPHASCRKYAKGHEKQGKCERKQND